ncbi:MAG: hypothetical protein M3R06_08315 [Chloroflexota bacterium]|nr:hypothetical protein [Chloroflexota bacterium]
MPALLPSFRVLRQTAEGWTPALDADGTPVRRVGLDPARSLDSAKEAAMRMADAESYTMFAVVDDSGAELYRHGWPSRVAPF